MSHPQSPVSNDSLEYVSGEIHLNPLRILAKVERITGVPLPSDQFNMEKCVRICEHIGRVCPYRVDLLSEYEVVFIFEVGQLAGL